MGVIEVPVGPVAVVVVTSGGAGYALPVNRPPFEDVFPEIEQLIKTHKWRQRLPGLEIEDVEQEMRLLAYKAWLRWEPGRGPLNKFWWTHWINYRLAYLDWYDRPKRSGMNLCSLDLWENEKFPVPNAEEIPVNGEPCPTDNLELRQMWVMYELQIPVAEIMSRLNLSRGQYAHRRALLQRALNGEDVPPAPTECEWCGEPLVGRSRIARFCCKQHRIEAYNHNLRLQRLAASSTADTSASSSAS